MNGKARIDGRIFWLGVVVLLLAPLTPRLELLNNPVLTEGKVIKIVGTTFSWGPLVEFNHESETYRFVGPMDGSYVAGDRVQVVFPTSRPERAAILDFLGLCGTWNTAFCLIGILVWSGAYYSYGSWRDKQFD